MTALVALLLLAQVEDVDAGTVVVAPPPAAIAVQASPTGFELALGPGIRVAPVLIADIDGRLYGSQDEGYNGFELARARVGLRASVFDLVDVVLISKLDGNSDSSKLFEGFISLKLPRGFYLEAGYSRSPLFVSGRDELEAWLPLQERSVTANALWPGRELGVLAAWLPRHRPIQAWFRLSNGSPSTGLNDNSSVAFDARVDVAFGRQLDTPEAFLGLRAGVGARYDPEVYDQLAVHGTTAGDFIFWRAPIVSGQRLLLEGHLIADLGPIELRLEGGWAKEQRSRDTDGNPLTPREQLASVQAGGLSAEVAWRILGAPRQPGVWPGGPVNFTRDGLKTGSFELAARAERLWLGVGANDITPSGTTAFGAAARYWTAWGVGASFGAYGYSFDTAPIETPGRTLTWLMLARVTAAIR